MKFHLAILLRNILATLVFIGACFTANAFNVNICVRLDPNSSADAIERYGYSWSFQPYQSKVIHVWEFYIQGKSGNMSNPFYLPDVATSIDYKNCNESPVIVNDQALQLLPANQMTINENPQTEDPIVIPAYALVAFKYCKIELYGTYHSGVFDTTYTFTATPIECNFPDYVVAPTIKK